MTSIKRIFLFIFCALPLFLLTKQTKALSGGTDCVDYFVVFARGSGETLNTNIDHQSFHQAISNIFQKLPNHSYKYYQLGESNTYGTPYPAIGTEKPEVATGAFISGGKAFQFGNSVKTGANELSTLYKKVSNHCPKTRFILAGYSQGAMVIDQVIQNINPKKLLYFASFGDPKLYLPEGKGIIPPACMNQHLSPYRQNVPDCFVEQGILGGKKPYISSKYKDKVGTWCNIADFMCGSSFDPLGVTDSTQEKANDIFGNIFNGHVSYSRFNAYKEAAEIIYHKILAIKKQHQVNNSMIYYYDPEQVQINPDALIHPSNPNPTDTKTNKNDLTIMLPTFPYHQSDDYILSLLSHIADIAHTYNCEEINYYRYGFFSPSEYNENNFHSQKLQNGVSKKLIQGIKKMIGLYTIRIDGGELYNQHRFFLNSVRDVDNVDLPSLVSTSIYDTIQFQKWQNKFNHLLLVVTPDPNPTQKYTEVSDNLIQSIKQQSYSKSITTFVYNENHKLSKLFSRFDFVPTQHIFNKSKPADQAARQILHYPQTQQIEHILKPRFDSISLRFTNDTFSYQRPLLKSFPKQMAYFNALQVSQHNFSKTNQIANSLNNNIYHWKIKQHEKIKEFTTKTPSLNLPLKSITSTEIHLTTPDQKSHQTSLYFLPKPFKNQQNISQITSKTIFPYQLIIIDDYIAGFTKNKHIKITDLDPQESHQIKRIKFSELGRIIEQKTTYIPAKNTTKADKTNLAAPSKSSSLRHQVVKLKDKVLLVPECGIKRRSPVQRILYFTNYF